MLHDHAGPRPSLFRRALAPALIFTVMPLASAFAQSHVRVTADSLEISSLRHWRQVKMAAPKGTVLEVMYVEGDRYVHREANWYWVLLPGDAYGTRVAGWVRGDKVEHAPAPEPPPPSRAAGAGGPRPLAATDGGTAAATAAVSVRPVAGEATVARPAARPARLVASDVVLNFEFGRSELTEEAKRKLASAVTTPPAANAQGLSVAVEGHADWVGSEGYNERLGLARAESVRRYLSEQFQIPADRITVVSYGESNPAAPNTTREGRATNRRVVIKGGA
jgi:outer membrane protein OmpA-like peptidoglycan-associated protein